MLGTFDTNVKKHLNHIESRNLIVDKKNLLKIGFSSLCGISLLLVYDVRASVMERWWGQTRGELVSAGAPTPPTPQPHPHSWDN